MKMELAGNKNMRASCSPSGKLHERAESGKCNVCSSPCLSCVHFNPSISSISLKPDNLLDEVSPRKTRISTGRQRASSETSSILSGYSTHDSFLQNEETNGSLRISDTSEGIVMLPNVAAGHILKPQKVLELNGDDMSCISGVDNPSRTVGRKSNSSVITSLRDVCAGASSSKEVLPECSLEQEGSSSARVESISLYGYKQTALDCVESVRPKGIEGDAATEVVKGSGRNESLVSLEVPNVHGNRIQSHQVGCDDGSDLLEDVRVCDICGDAGREDLLAICSKCCDGAEHTYCMRVRLDKLPKGDWFCEECLLREENEKQNQKKFGELVGTSKDSSSNSIHRKSDVSSSSNSKAFLELESRRRNVAKSARDEVNSIRYFSTKRFGGPIESGSEVKRRALETNVGSDKVSIHSRINPSRDSSFKKIDETSLGNARLPIISGAKSQKFQSRPLVSRGILTKSNSFHCSAPKQKVQLREGCLQKQKSLGENVTSEKRNEATVRVMSKSLSFNNTSSGCSSAAEAKSRPPSTKFSHVEDLKRSRQFKGHDSLLNNRRELDNTLLSSPITGSCISSSKKDNKSEMAVQCHASSNNSSKSTSHLVHDGSKSSVRFATSGTLKRLPSCLSNVTGAVTSDLSQEQMRNTVVPKDNMRQVTISCATISPQNPVLDAKSYVCENNKVECEPKYQPDASRILAVPEVDSIWKGGFEINTSKRLPNTCFGIQAHLSTCASPKVPEVVKQFPRKVILEEVPRLSTWPAQFMVNHPKEDSIGLYFFAEDLESYMRNYKRLSECMIDHDLALRGNFDGIELLIFSSKMLPETSQRWNRMFFLWGVFRERKVSNVERMPTSTIQNCVSTMTYASPDQELSMPGVPGPRSMCSSGNSSERLLESKLNYDVQESPLYANSLEVRSVPSRRRDEDCKLRITSSEPKHFSSLTNFVQPPRDDIRSSPLSTPIKVEQLSGNNHHTATFLKEHGSYERSNKKDMPRWLSGGEASNMEVEEDFRINDRDDQIKSELLVLGLSPDDQKKETLELMPLSLGVVDEKKKNDESPNPVSTKVNNDDYGDEFPNLLELSLGLPSYGK